MLIANMKHTSYLKPGLIRCARKAGSNRQLAGLHVTERCAVHYSPSNDTVIVILIAMLCMDRYAV